jgi:DNA sulfur modification protein DndB
MSEYLGPLLTEIDKINSSVRIRKKKVIEKSITSTNPDLLKDKLELEVADGWKFLRKNTKSYRVCKDKPLDEQLEDEVFCFLAEMQFKEVSDGRYFKVKANEDGEPRQIDVFAKDDDTAIFIECTQSDTPKQKQMGKLIEKIESFRDKISKSIVSHYGKEPKLKQGWVIATRNIDWYQADLTKAKEANITILRDAQLNYYMKFTRLYKLAAKYQFLSHIFANQSILGLDLVVPATRGSMGGRNFYNFLIKPADLLKIAHVSHKASREVEDLETYQRMLKPKRLTDLANYIDNGGQFPTNIVINIRSKKKLVFERIGKKGESEFGNLTLPNCYASAMVIDGQHRLYGYAHSQRVLNGQDDKSTIPVLAYENLEPTKEAKLFVDINCEQVRVTRNLLNEINATLYWDSDDFNLRVDALCSRVVMTLNGNKTSPFYDRIKMTTKDQTILRCLTLTSFIDGLKENKFFGETKGGAPVPGLLSDKNFTELEKTLQRSIAILSGYFGMFADKAKVNWSLGNKKKEKENQIGYLATNEGTRSLLKVLREVLLHIQQKSGMAIDSWDLEELINEINKYCLPIAEVFETTNFSNIHNFRSRGGIKGVTQNSIIMQSFIHKGSPDFNPSGLASYLETIDEEGTKQAKELIGEIQLQLHSFVIYKLKENHPKDEDWWYEGVRSTIRTRCSEDYEKGKGTKKREQYMKTLDYQQIAADNWKDCFETPFSFQSKGNKEAKLAWLKDLNEIRNITHHEEKWPATKDQVAFIRDIHSKIMDRLIIPEN